MGGGGGGGVAIWLSMGSHVFVISQAHHNAPWGYEGSLQNRLFQPCMLSPHRWGPVSGRLVVLGKWCLDLAIVLEMDAEGRT